MAQKTGSCALGHQACREGYTVLYLRLPRLLQDLPLAKGDGRYPKLMASLAKIALLILDDWGLASLSDENRRDVLALLEDRHGRSATLVTSQLPGEHWHEALGNPTLADAMYAPVCTRFVTYGVALPEESASYRDHVMNWPLMDEWIKGAVAEPEEIEELDMEF